MPPLLLTCIRYVHQIYSLPVELPNYLLVYTPTQRGGFSLGHVEAEVEHVSLLYDVLLALAPQQPLLLRGLFTAAFHEVLVLDRLRPNETPAEKRDNKNLL